MVIAPCGVPAASHFPLRLKATFEITRTAGGSRKPWENAVMRRLTYFRPNPLEWWNAPAPRLRVDGDAFVQPLADLTTKVVFLRERIE